jgi:pimeloyl-ACP methyl ester carboxylesterase
MAADDPVAAWQKRGRHLEIDGKRVFVVDIPAANDVDAAPALVLHGFPTCSFDWRNVVDSLAHRRRVVLLDFLGFGLSDKPDRRYSIRLHADTAAGVADALGLERIVLVTHDMGDTIGGELLARDLAGESRFEITARVITNGSIYIALAHLTDGQQFLLALDDAAIDFGADGSGFRSGLGQTFSSKYPASDAELEAQWRLVATNDGNRLLPRLIRYIEDRRAEERRFTGAIERHRSPLGVVWGMRDPVAVPVMVERLVEARPDIAVIRFDDVGHYPMVETPDRFAAAVDKLLPD